MDYSISKHKAIRAAVTAAIGTLPELPGGAENARVMPFTEDETEFPVAVVFTGNDSAETTDDEQNLRRDYDVDIVIISRGRDISVVNSGEDSFIDMADDAANAVENTLSLFHMTLSGLIYRLKYQRSSAVIEDAGDFFQHVRIITYTAHSIEKLVNAPG